MFQDRCFRRARVHRRAKRGSLFEPIRPRISSRSCQPAEISPFSASRALPSSCAQAWRLPCRVSSSSCAAQRASLLWPWLSLRSMPPAHFAWLASSPKPGRCWTLGGFAHGPPWAIFLVQDRSLEELNASRWPGSRGSVALPLSQTPSPFRTKCVPSRHQPQLHRL
jgi:hypothetical protein